jgi:hypothetical protein
MPIGSFQQELPVTPLPMIGEKCAIYGGSGDL